MRIPSLPCICLALCFSSSVYADLSLSDLPYLQGTPISDGTWEILDHSHGNQSIQWIWLQQGANSAYVIYPSEEPVLLPDNSLVPASIDQMTLIFAGDAEQELIFTRFGNAHITLIGDSAQVRYTAVAANTAAGPYPGDLSMDGKEIHMEGELTLEGTMTLDTRETLGLYGDIVVEDQLFINAGTGVVMGSVENNGTLLLDACGMHSGVTLTSVHFDDLPLTKGCLGDVQVMPEVNLEHEPLAVSTSQTGGQSSGSSKGGSADWWFLSLLTIFFGFSQIRWK